MRGNGTNCIRIVPYSAVQFASYSFYKRVSSTAEPRGEGAHWCVGYVPFNESAKLGGGSDFFRGFLLANISFP